MGNPHICTDKAKYIATSLVFLLIVPMQVTMTTGPSPHKDDMEESCMAIDNVATLSRLIHFHLVTRVHVAKVSLSKRWGAKIRWLVSILPMYALSRHVIVG